MFVFYSILYECTYNDIHTLNMFLQRRYYIRYLLELYSQSFCVLVYFLAVSVRFNISAGCTLTLTVNSSARIPCIVLQTRPTTYRLHTDNIPTTYRLHTDNIPTTYRLHTDNIPTTYRLHTDYIPTTYRQHTDYIPTTLAHGSIPKYNGKSQVSLDNTSMGECEMVQYAAFFFFNSV